MRGSGSGAVRILRGMGHPESGCGPEGGIRVVIAWDGAALRAGLERCGKLKRVVNRCSSGRLGVVLTNLIRNGDELHDG